ncbi:hypothetical protein BKA70DRAFT_1329955, partial [Coprinopsis sp. MPI-PUGE-AT-0042]
TWYLCGKHYLYQDIDIRRSPQLFQLLASLKEAPENAGLVKGLQVSRLIDTNWAYKFSETLQSVVNQLPSLLVFTLRSPSTNSEALGAF